MPTSPSQSPAETAWELVHGRGISVRIAASRMGISRPAVLQLLAIQKPIVRDRQWASLRYAGESFDGRSDWPSQRIEALSVRARELRSRGYLYEVIAERLGVSISYVDYLIKRDVDETTS